MITDFERWREELLFTGNIIQDGDTSVPADEGGKRVLRYLELLDMVEGNEGQPVFEALVNSVQAQEDYGVYQSTLGTANKFPGEVYAKGLLNTLPQLIDRHQDWAGEFLIEVVKTVRYDDSPYIRYFNEGLLELDLPIRQKIVRFIRSQEDGEDEYKDAWLQDFEGLLAPGLNYE